MSIEERLKEKIQDFMIMCRFQEAIELDSELSDFCRELNAEIIKPAITEEREDCAKIADDLARQTREEWEENPLLSLRGTENCEAIRDAIRARSDEKPP